MITAEKVFGIALGLTSGAIVADSCGCFGELAYGLGGTALVFASYGLVKYSAGETATAQGIDKMDEILDGVKIGFCCCISGLFGIGIGLGLGFAMSAGGFCR